MGDAFAVIDVGPERMEGHPALAIPLGTGDFGAAEASGAIDADAFGTKPHGRLNDALHGPADGNPALHLLGDVFGHQLGLDLGLADFDDVQVRLRPGHIRNLAPKILDIDALLADNHARTRRMDGYAGLFRRPFDDDLGHAGLGQALEKKRPDLQILVQKIGVVSIGVPA